jgi:DNA-binding response OmpR family regulator
VASTSPSQSQKTERRRALLIEPSPEPNVNLAGLFDQSVWAVNYADDNEMAIEMAKTEAFDLILTNAATTCAEDIVVLQRLRMVRPHTRVIILTKEWLPGDILKAIRNHAFSYFTMPIAIEDLREFIKYALEQPVWDDGIEMIQGNMGYVVLAVRCDLGTLERLMQFMRESVALPEVECEEVAFALREITLNAMEHGGKFDPGQFVDPVVAWPGWYEYPGIWYGGPYLSFGVGFGIGYYGGYGWGWHHWGSDWHNRSVTYHHDKYYSRSRTFYNRNDYYQGGEGRSGRHGNRGGYTEHPGEANRSVREDLHPSGGTSNRLGATNATPRPFNGNTQAARGYAEPRGQSGAQSGAFSNYNHGGETRSYSSRGSASFGGGGSYGGGSHGGGHH